MKEELKKSEEVIVDQVKEVGEQNKILSSGKVAKKNKRFRQIHKGKAYVQSTYNNTIVSITDLNGSVLGWSSSGLLGFKGAKKSTPYVASQVVSDVVDKIQKYGLKELQVFVKGLGGGRDSAVRALANKGFNISLIKDVTPIAHNGCKRRKPRHV